MASTVGNATSPSMGRISVEHHSIATTVSDFPSNASSPNVGSPQTSGALSPLDSRTTTAAATKRLFNLTITQQKLVMLAHPTFCLTERVLSWEEFEEFRRCKQLGPSPSVIEKDDEKAVAVKEGSLACSSRREGSVFNEDEERLYFQDFPIKSKVSKKEEEVLVLKTLPLLLAACTISRQHKNQASLNVHVGRSAVSGFHQNVTACEITDSIALFCLSNKKVEVHHVSAAEPNDEAVRKQFELLPCTESTYSLYLGGGNGSSASVKLLQNIEAAILHFFGDKGVIRERFINPNEQSSKSSISVVFTTRRKFFFCRHD
jgi:hypothetical protein